MPTKEWYLENYSAAADMLDHAIANYNASPKISWVRKSNDLKNIKVTESGNPDNYAEGSGNTNREAMAEALGIFTS